VGRELGLFGNPPGIDHISFAWCDYYRVEDVPKPRVCRPIWWVARKQTAPEGAPEGGLLGRLVMRAIFFQARCAQSAQLVHL